MQTNSEQNPKKSQKTKAIAFSLCFFFAPLGFHRLYVGKIKTGMLMLLLGGTWYYWFIQDLLTSLSAFNAFGALDLTTISNIQSMPTSTNPWMTGFGTVLFIWVLIDLILIVTGNFKDNEGKTLA